MKKKILSLCAAVVFLSMPGWAFAQELDPIPPTIQVSPIRLDWSFLSGEERTGIINLKNYSDRPYEVKASVEDFTVTPDSSQALFYIPEENDPLKAYDVINWIEFPVKEIVLAPGESKDFYFKNNVPKDAPTGGYYGGIFFQYAPKADATAPDGAAVMVNTRIGVLLTMAVKGKEPIRQSGDLIEFNATKKLFFEQPAGFITKISNSGNLHYKAGGKITIKRFGQAVSEMELDSRIFYPGKIRSLDSGWNFGYWDFGPFEAVLSLTSEDGNIQVEGRTSFWVIPWKTVAAVVGIMLFLFTLYKLILLKGKRDARKEREKERREWEERHGVSREE